MYSTKNVFTLVLLSIGAIIILVCSPFLGIKPLSPLHLFHDYTENLIFTAIRIPRVLLGFCTGSSLALCGMVFQALFRNPLATPYTLGIHSGAACGAAGALLFFPVGTILGIPLSIIGAFIGGLIAIGFVILLCSFKAQVSNITILLAGLSVSFVFSSLLMFFQFISNEHNSFQIIRWLMGGLETFGYFDVRIALIFMIIGVGTVFIYIRELDMLLVGEEIAQTRGVAVARVKIILLIIISMVVSACVSVCGPIGFVGLMSAHICRLIVGIKHTILAPTTLLFGDVFLVVCDTVGRTAFLPQEIPVGLITSLVGGPFFIWLLFRKKTA